MKFSNTAPCRILIVDRSTEVLSLMSSLFRPYGFDLVIATTPDDALEQARLVCPHAVYMGLDYDDCDGWLLAAQLRALPGMQGTMLVGLVAQDELTGLNRASARRHFNHFFPKPPCMRDIFMELARVAERMRNAA